MIPKSYFIPVPIKSMVLILAVCIWFSAVSKFFLIMIHGVTPILLKMLRSVVNSLVYSCNPIGIPIAWVEIIRSAMVRFGWAFQMSDLCNVACPGI